MYYYNTKHALLSAFDKGDAFFSTMQWNYETEFQRKAHRAVLSRDEKLAQDEILLAYLRKELTRYDYQLLMFCYSLDNQSINESWNSTVKPVVLMSSHLAERLGRNLKQWAVERYTRTGLRGNMQPAHLILDVTRKTVLVSLSKRVDEVLTIDIDLAFERVEWLLNDKEWLQTHSNIR